MGICLAAFRVSWFLGFVFFTCALLAGCGQHSPAPTLAPATATRIILLSPTLVPTYAPSPTIIPTEAPTKTPVPPTATPSPTPTEMPKPSPTAEVSKAPQVDGLTLKLNAQTGISEYFTPEGVYAGKFIPNAVKINQETTQRGVIAISNLKVAEQLTKNANKPEAVAQGGWKMIFPIIMDNKKSGSPLEIVDNNNSKFPNIILRNVGDSMFVSPFSQNEVGSTDPEGDLNKNSGFNLISITLPDFMAPIKGINYGLGIYYVNGSSFLESKAYTSIPIKLGEVVLNNVSGKLPTPPFPNGNNEVIIAAGSLQGAKSVSTGNILIYSGSPVFFGGPAAK